MTTRKPIPKKVRFEVFKRDSFKCQYCGRSAPDVILRVDHIDPVANGGANDILNLITACQDCNAGKGAVKLDDSTAVSKSREQARQLQERRQQIEMMMEWKRGLLSVEDLAVDQASRYFAEATPGLSLNDNGRNSVRQLLRKYSLGEVLSAIDISRKYLVIEDGECTSESFNRAIGKVGGICYLTRQKDQFPHLEELYRIRGIIRYRAGSDDSYKGHQAIEAMKRAVALGIDIAEIRRVARSVGSWNRFIETIEGWIAEEEQGF